MKINKCVLFYSDKNSVLIEGIVKCHRPAGVNTIYAVIYKCSKFGDGLSAAGTEYIQIPNEENIEESFNTGLKDIQQQYFKNSYYEED